MAESKESLLVRLQSFLDETPFGTTEEWDRGHSYACGQVKAVFDAFMEDASTRKDEAGVSMAGVDCLVSEAAVTSSTKDEITRLRSAIREYMGAQNAYDAAPIEKDYDEYKILTESFATLKAIAEENNE